MLNATDRVIFLDYATDSAIVLFVKGDLQFPQVPVTLLPVDEPCKIGSDVGWLGYPGIEPNTLCFFAGTVSARQAQGHSYLIDGVSIHGISGGPVFHCTAPNVVQVIGIVTAYHANRATGEALPGLLRAQDVSHFHSVAAHIRTIDEANAAKREFDEAQKMVEVPVEPSPSIAPISESPKDNEPTAEEDA